MPYADGWFPGLGCSWLVKPANTPLGAPPDKASAAMSGAAKKRRAALFAAPMA